MARAWYYYNNVGDPFLPSSYLYYPVKPRCINGFIPCAIYSKDGLPPTPPYLSNNLLHYIAAGLSTGLAQPIGPVKKYVYMKSSYQ